MVKVAEHAGFPKIIIVRNGMEGSIAFPLKRAVKILCVVKQQDNQYFKKELVIKPEEFLTEEVVVEERLDQPSLKKNIEFIKEYFKSGTTKNSLFDHRVKFTCFGLEKAVEWVNKNGGKK